MTRQDDHNYPLLNSEAEVHLSRTNDDVVEAVLTRREEELCKLLVEARSDREIASRMGITGHTVRFHISNIFRKLNVTSRAHLLVACFRSGFGKS